MSMGKNNLTVLEFVFSRLNRLAKGCDIGPARVKSSLAGNLTVLEFVFSRLNRLAKGCDIGTDRVKSSLAGNSSQYCRSLCLLFVCLCIASTYGQADPNVAKVDDSVDVATVINISGNLSHDGLGSVYRQIDRSLDQGLGKLIFRISGRGRSFKNFSELGQRIIRLAQKDNVWTVAYIPTEAKGMSMLAVLACSEIVAGEFAQLGQVGSHGKLSREEPKTEYVDEQTVVTKMVGFARANSHDEQLARAMVQKRMILYEIKRGVERKLVDQSGFERHTRQQENTWKMVGTGPIVGADEVLLLDGRGAEELGLVDELVANEDELQAVLGIKLIKVKPKDKKEAVKKLVTDESEETVISMPDSKANKAAFIVCSEMVDEGLYESIKRRTKEALDSGATYIIYEMDTFGGRVDSAISIHNYILGDVARQAHTVAYIRTKAISAGALISVACQDIIMKANAKLGDCAPISMGGKLEGVEREKIETVLRTYFEDAANTNGYPIALCKAMVTIGIEVYKIKNIDTDKFEYVEGTMINNRPFNDPYMYDLEDKVLVDTKEHLLTVYADKAREYGLTRTIVDGDDEQSREKLLKFLEERDGISFDRPATYLKTNWSEELVRWLTSPAVSGILMMIAMLGIYAELNSPGLGLPGAVAVVALVVLFGSKFLIGMANWWEIAIFVIGLCLLIAEIFIIPGFGVAGISGTFMMIFALGAMMVGNKPDEWPVPVSPFEWDMFEKHLFWMLAGCVTSIIGAYFIGRYLPKIPVANRLILAMPRYSAEVRSGGVPAPAPPPPVKVGEQGMSTGRLRPSGFGKFGNNRLDVVTRGELVEPNRKIMVVEIEGNSIVVKEV